MIAAGLCAGSSARRAGKDPIRSWDPGRNRGKHMNASLLAVLSDAERLLVAQTEPAELAALDEDAAIEFEARIRRARNKYVGQYRRGASTRVAKRAVAVRHGRRTRGPPSRPRRSKRPCPGPAAGSRCWPGSPQPGCARSGLRPPGPGGRVEDLPRGGRRLARAGKGLPSPPSPPVTVPCARPPLKRTGQAPSPWVPGGRRSETAGRAQAGVTLG